MNVLSMKFVVLIKVHLHSAITSAIFIATNVL